MTSAERILSRSACLMKRGPPQDIFLFFSEREEGESAIFLKWTLDKWGLYMCVFIFTSCALSAIEVLSLFGLFLFLDQPQIVFFFLYYGQLCIYIIELF